MLANYTIDGFENIKYQGFGKLRFIKDRLSNLFERFGYCQVETPTFENYEFYLSEDGINRDELFKLIDSTGKVLALKPDATLPVTRMAAINHHDPEEIIKFCYQTNIYKDFSLSETSKKETTQSGIEYFGNSSPECDGEVIMLAILALSGFGVEEIHIDLGHVGYINALLDELRLNKIDREKLFNYIENKNLGDIREFLSGRDNIPERYKKILMKLPMLYGDAETVFERMRELAINPKMEAVEERLESIYSYLCDLGMGRHINVDVGFTSRMNYYTGMIFKGYIPGCGEPIISGGRYDGLSSRFGIDRPACGFSLDLLLLLEYLSGSGLLPDKGEPKSVVLYEPGCKNEAFEFCNSIRKDGRSSEMFVLDRKPKDMIDKIMRNSHYEGSEIVLMDSNGLSKYDGEGFVALREEA